MSTKRRRDAELAAAVDTPSREQLLEEYRKSKRQRKNTNKGGTALHRSGFGFGRNTTKTNSNNTSANTSTSSKYSVDSDDKENPAGLRRSTRNSKKGKGTPTTTTTTTTTTTSSSAKTKATTSSTAFSDISNTANAAPTDTTGDDGESIDCADVSVDMLSDSMVAPLADGSCQVATLADDAFGVLSVEAQQALEIKIVAPKFDYKKKIAKMGACIKETRRCLNSLLNEKDVFVERVAAIEAGLVAQLATRNADAESHAENVESLESQIAELQSVLTTTKAKLAEAEATGTANAALLSEAQTSLAETTAALGQMTDALAASKAELEAANAEKSKLKSELAENWDAHTRYVKEQEAKLTSMKENLSGQLAEALADKAALTTECSKLNERRITLETQLSGAESERARVESELATVTTKLEEKTAELAAANTEVVRAQAFTESITRERDGLKDELVAARSSWEAERTALATERGTLIASHDTERATWKANNEALEAEFTSVKESFAEVNAAHTALEAETEQLRATAAEMTAAAESLPTVKSELETANAELTELRAELEAYRENTGSDCAAQMENIAALSLEAERLRSALVLKGNVEETLAEKEARLQAMARALFERETEVRQLHNSIQELKGNVRMIARVRPFLGGEAASASSASGVIECAPNGTQLACDDGSGRKVFTFDKVFDADSTQDGVFEEVSSFVQSAVDGYDVCLFAYGMTGSGKTHTMQGSTAGEHSGIIPRAVAKVIAHVDKMSETGWEFELECTFVEIYNETLRDLLAEDDTNQSKLGIKLDKSGRPFVAGTEKVIVTEENQVLGLLDHARGRRAVGSTAMNARSSRSHVVFTLSVRGVNKEMRCETVGSLNLCDLAGSERLDRSGATGKRLKETQHINKSLSALADVYYGLASKNSHIPYRNSKLTHMLQSCFSGQGKTLMVVCLSPTTDSVSESMCTLRFSSKVKAVELGAAKKRVRRTAAGSESGGPADETDTAEPKAKRPRTAPPGRKNSRK